MGNTGQVILPNHELAEQLATIFGDFYIDKVATIRRNINIGNPSDIYETALGDDVMFDGIPLQRFEAVSRSFRAVDYSHYQRQWCPHVSNVQL